MGKSPSLTPRKSISSRASQKEGVANPRKTKIVVAWSKSGLRPESTDDTRPTDHREDAGTVASEVDDTTGAEAEAVEDDGGLPDFDTP
jgi:hypothetical protein